MSTDDNYCEYTPEDMPAHFTVHTSWVAADAEGTVVAETQVFQVLKECICVEPPLELRARIIFHLRREVGWEE